ncbi:MAG: TetR/AcrR family transcriptional regulator [Treponemataceae bacterium]
MEETQTTTAKKLEASAITLFARKWYSSVSVAEICRHAGLSNGIFYKYFQNKEILVRQILEDAIDGIAGTLEKVSGNTARERLACLMDRVVNFSADNPELITVFREGQYRFFEYERRLTDLYRKALGKAVGKNVGNSEYLFAIGGLRFASIRSALHGSRISKSALTSIICDGIFKGLDWSAEKVFNLTVTPSPISLDDETRERLLRAGKRLFGEKGYHTVNIHEVTDAAGLSVGAFYRYFESKDVFFAELIEHAGHQVRRFIHDNLSPGLNRLEREMQGIYLFGVFLTLDRWCYNIVREGEFVAPAKVREYYGAFVHGYQKSGAEAMDSKIVADDPLYESTAIEFMLGISHYYGIEIVFDDSPHNARSVVEGIGNYLLTGLLSGA